MMKNERMMKKIKKNWRQLRLRFKLRMKADQSEHDSGDKDKFLKNAIKHEAEEDDEDDNAPKTCAESFEKYVMIPGKSKFLLYWSMFMALVISVSFFLIGITLAFGLVQLDDTKPIEEIFDFIFMGDIISKFFTAYYYDVKLVTHPFRIAKRYILTFFLFDIISTVPTLVTYQHEDIYFLKIFRVVRLVHIVAPLVQVLDMINIDKLLRKQLKSFIRLMVILFSTIHILA